MAANQREIRMLRTVGELVEGEVYAVPHAKAISWVESGIASFRVSAVEASTSAEVISKAPRKSPRNKMVQREARK